MKRIVLAILLAMVFLSFASVVSAVHAQGPEQGEPSLRDLITKISIAILPAIVSAIGNSLLGYFSNTNPDDFDPAKFLATLLMGMVIGAITVVTGWTYTQAEQWLANAALTIWIYWVAKIAAIKAGWIQLKETQVTPKSAV